MRVRLINPDNPVVSLSKVSSSRLNKYRVWKPLSLLVLAGLTPEDWEVEVIDENLGPVGHRDLPRPDLVGITAFTSQATRAFELAELYRSIGVPVVMGGIHASTATAEATQYADAVVTGEAEAVWGRVLEDAKAGRLEKLYPGGLGVMEDLPAARHDLLRGQYYFGSIQTTRGCPLACSFCSVTVFNGRTFRHRPIENVIEELRLIEEKVILFVDDNLIGTRKDHIEYSKTLFREMIREGLTKPWACQATINFADDPELLELARRAGCLTVFIGFESPTTAGLVEVRKKFNLQRDRNLPDSVRRIQKAGIGVIGSFIMGLDADRPGIGRLIAEAADLYRIDMANVLILTPLPGTALWNEMEAQGRIIATDFPHDWKYYTLSHPVAKYINFTWGELVQEMNRFHDLFYAYPKILRRIVRLLRHTRRPLRLLGIAIGSLTYRCNHLVDRHVYDSRAEPDRALACGAPAASRGIVGLSGASDSDTASGVLRFPRPKESPNATKT